MILLALVGLGLVAAFWFLVMAPKRAEVTELDDKIATAQAAAEEQEQLAAFAETAKDGYDNDYQKLVVLGKAVPSDSDQASLVEQINAKSVQAGIDFQGLVLASEGEAAEAPPPAATDDGGAPAAAPAEGEAAPVAATPAPATEAAAATLPIGATVGPAGLPVMPYDLNFTGEFFDIADFMEGLDGMVKTKAKGQSIGVAGRLLTVDGFALSPDENRGFPVLDADLHVTTFVTPADQGITGGATPSAPAPSTSITTTPAPAPPVAATTAP
jgi:hypothetical protein